MHEVASVKQRWWWFLYSRVAERIMNPLYVPPLLPMSRMALMGSGRWVGTILEPIKTACVYVLCVCMLSEAHARAGSFKIFEIRCSRVGLVLDFA